MALDPDEPARVAAAVRELALSYVVITSVTRDDLHDGGAQVFAETIRQIRKYNTDCRVEVLVPDFNGLLEALQIVLEAFPDVLNHNLETVLRLYPQVRPQADYSRSLRLLQQAKELSSNIVTKSGIMVGLGETWDELIQAMADLCRVNCDILTVGQYLQPSKCHIPVAKYYAPEEFEQLAAEGERLGFHHVESGPLVRSSYRAHAQLSSIVNLRSAE